MSLYCWGGWIQWTQQINSPTNEDTNSAKKIYTTARSFQDYSIILPNSGLNKTIDIMQKIASNTLSWVKVIRVYMLIKILLTFVPEALRRHC